MMLWFFLGTITGFSVAIIVLTALNASADAALRADEAWRER